MARKLTGSIDPVSLQPPQQQQAQPSIAQGSSDFLRDIGLGAIPNLAANVTDIGNTVMSGKKIDTKNNYSNPFRTQQQVQKQFPKAGRTDIGLGEKMTQGYGQWAKDTLGLAAYGVPLGGAKTALTRAGLGATSGALHGVSQDDATLPSVAGSAFLGGALNVALPAITKKISEGLGRVSLGPGGERLPELSKASGTKIQGSAKTVKDNIFVWTEPIRKSIEKTLSGSKGTINLREVYGKDGVMAKTLEKIPDTQKQDALAYIALKRRAINKVAKKYLESQGMSSVKALNEVQWGDVNLPLSFWQDQLQNVGGDLGSRWERIATGKATDAMSKVGKSTYGFLSKQIQDRSADPQTVKYSQELLQASSKISSSLGKRLSSPGAIQNLQDVLQNLGLPAGAIYGLLTGNVPVAAGSAIVEAATNPAIATRISNQLAAPSTKVITDLLQRLGVSGANKLFR